MTEGKQLMYGVAVGFAVPCLPPLVLLCPSCLSVIIPLFTAKYHYQFSKIPKTNHNTLAIVSFVAFTICGASGEKNS